MKDVGLRSTCTRFENFTIERGRRKGRREEERRSTKCEITGIGRDIGGENESGNSQCNKSRIKWISGLRREAQISEESNTMYTLQNKQTNKSETKRIKKRGYTKYIGDARNKMRNWARIERHESTVRKRERERERK